MNIRLQEVYYEYHDTRRLIMNIIIQEVYMNVMIQEIYYVYHDTRSLL